MKAFITGLIVAILLLLVAAFFALRPAQTTLAGAAIGGPQASQHAGVLTNQGVQAEANVASLAAVPPAPAASPTCAPSWAIVASLNPSTGSPQYGTAINTFTGVSVVSAGDVWAVGFYSDPGLSKPASPTQHVARHSPNDKNGPLGSYGGVLRTLAEHWDGTAWTVVPSANLGSDDNELLSVVALSAGDVWAAGYYLNSFGVSQTLIENWDGTAWRVVASPNVGGLLDNELTTIDAVSPGDVFAAGYYYNDQAVAQTLIEHYDGTAWSIVASPNMGSADNTLYSVSMVSATDAWAVGYYTILNASGGTVYKSLAEHWNGATWSVVATPNIGSFSNVFYGVDAVSSNDVWAVGTFAGSNRGPRSLLEHWDGASWNPVASPSLGIVADSLYSVEAIAQNDVWAVGQLSSYNGPSQPLTEHWNGTEWSQVRIPGANDNSYAALLSVSAVASGDLWAVGSLRGGNYDGEQTLAEHYSTACVSCPLRFTDVSPQSPFYAYIQCLACQGIVSGYPCEDPASPCMPPQPVPSSGAGTPFPTNTPTPTAVPGSSGFYRPGSPVTRGELAKIISNSSFFEEDPGGQIYADVSTYSTFYSWINRLSHRGVIGGYPCGTVPQEPCDSNHTPYFRPGDNASRGQIAKLVSNARGYSDPVPPTQQSFRDVPTSSPFWLYIERLRLNGSVISGYSCGAVGEPCPGAYFRPQNNASRGQVAKIVSKAFFPNCYTP